MDDFHLYISTIGSCSNYHKSSLLLPLTTPPKLGMCYWATRYSLPCSLSCFPLDGWVDVCMCVGVGVCVELFSSSPLLVNVHVCVSYVYMFVSFAWVSATDHHWWIDGQKDINYTNAHWLIAACEVWILWTRTCGEKYYKMTLHRSATR